jgi:hypothetical protein
MTSPAPECIRQEPENREVWPNSDRGEFATATAGNVTSGSEFAFSGQPAIIPKVDNNRYFFQAFMNFRAPPPA